jgi:hypothetical protein
VTIRYSRRTSTANEPADEAVLDATATVSTGYGDAQANSRNVQFLFRPL